jgi:hypothetical protein
VALIANNNGCYGKCKNQAVKKCLFRMLSPCRADGEAIQLEGSWISPDASASISAPLFGRWWRSGGCPSFASSIPGEIIRGRWTRCNRPWNPVLPPLVGLVGFGASALRADAGLGHLDGAGCRHCVPSSICSPRVGWWGLVTLLLYGGAFTLTSYPDPAAGMRSARSGALGPMTAAWASSA